MTTEQKNALRHYLLLRVTQALEVLRQGRECPCLDAEEREHIDRILRLRKEDPEDLIQQTEFLHDLVRCHKRRRALGNQPASAVILRAAHRLRLV